MLVVIGHTAGGKTSLAANLALHLDGEVISADSRQVYRGMDIGTGKDLSDYRIGNVDIKYHLIDVVDAGGKYTLYHFQEDFRNACMEIRQHGKLPILCGGTGLYTESALKGFNMAVAPFDYNFRNRIAGIADQDLITMLKSFGPLHNQSDTTDRDRLIRAIEIARAKQNSPAVAQNFCFENPIVFAISYPTEMRRQRITMRLSERLANGMIEEVKELLERIDPEDLMYYGLEYKYLTLYCLGKITYDEMFTQLNTAIHQFSKRQMTWFRGMERRGISITWIPGELTLEEKIATVLKQFPA